MPFPCPCCGYLTFGQGFPGSFTICPICFWEDDNVQFDDPDFAGGANSPSHRQAQMNFERCGASDPALVDLVRPPGPDDKRAQEWRRIPDG